MKITEKQAAFIAHYIRGTEDDITTELIEESVKAYNTRDRNVKIDLENYDEYF